jgi:hypothetical protein
MYSHSHRCGLCMKPCWCVEKSAYATSFQDLKKVAKAKQNLTLKQSCGSHKTAAPTQRKKNKALREVTFEILGAAFFKLNVTIL